MAFFTPIFDGDQLTTEEMAFIQNLASLDYEQGDIIYHDGEALAVLKAGNAGEVLSTGGAGANPSWVPASGVIFETPPESSGTTFTVANDPLYIIVNGIIYFEGLGYSYAAGTITLDFSLTGWIRSAHV